AMTGPSAPGVPATVAGTNLSFAWDQNATRNAATSMGCTAVWAQPKWTFTCPPTKKIVNVGTFSVGGGIAVDFALTGANDVTYNFSGSIPTAGTVNFGPGIYNVVGGISTSGTTTFAASAMHVGGVLSVTGTTTFAAGTYKLSNGLTTGGGST